jgi:hypothetical protein
MRIGLAVQLALVGAAASVSADPHPGHVVRVERAPRRASGVPRICMLTAGNGANGVCLGPAPKLGDEIRIVGATHLVGTVRITQLRSVTACGEDPSLAWQVQTEPEGTLDPDGPGDDSVGVIDVTADPHAHLIATDTLPPGVGATAIPARAIDTDGDGVLDIEFTIAPCDGTASSRSMCIDVWTSTDGHALQRFRRDAIEEGCS